MALTLPRWIALALMGGLVSLTLVLGVHTVLVTESTRTRPAVLVEYDRTSAMATRLAQRLNILRLRDSALNLAMRSAPTAPRLTVVMDPALSPKARLLLDSAIRLARSRTDTPQPAGAMVVAFLVDTERSVDGIQFAHSEIAVDYALPQADGSPCLVLVRLHPEGDSPAPINVQIERFVMPIGLGPRLFGPCAFYHAFGVPGARIGQWLRAGAVEYAHYASWSASGRERPRRLGQPYEPEAARRVYGGIGTAIQYRSERFELERLRRSLSNQALACLTGDTAFCTQTLDHPDPEWAAARVWGHSIYSRPDAYSRDDISSYQRSSMALGPGQATFLSGLVQTLGVSQFAAVWRSPLPLAEAFRAAGLNGGEVTRTWFQARYMIPRRGPGLPMVGWLAALAAVAAGLGLATMSANRKQTG